MADKSWITPPKIIIRKNRGKGPQKLCYWVDKNGKNHLYTREELAICNILTNLNIILIRALIIVDTLKNMDRNAKIKKLVNQDYSRYKVTQSSIFNRFIALMAAAPDITFGEFLSFISGNSDPDTLIKIGQNTFAKASRGKNKTLDVFYTSDLLKK
jgi:hypothetical protein